MKNKLKICLAIWITVCAVRSVCAQNGQDEIVITHQANTFGQKPIPISLEGFTGEVADVLKFDLYVQGFSFVAPDAAQYRISGSSVGNVQGALTDAVSRQMKFSRSYT